MFRKQNRGLILNDLQTETKNIVINKLKDGSYCEEEKLCLCGSNNFEVLAQEDRYGIPFRTVICKECGLIYSNPYYDKSSLNDFYKNYYRNLYSSGGCSEEQFNSDVLRGNMIIKNIEKLFKKKISNLKIFEIGCGSGALLQAFKNNNCEVAGCDYKTAWSEYGRQKGINIEEGSFQVLEKYGKADIIILSHILEHIPNPFDFLSEVCKLLLKENGIVYFILPTLETIPRNYNYNIFYYLQNAHLYCFSKNTAKYVIEKSGLKVIKIIEKDGVFIAKINNSDYLPQKTDKNEYKKTMVILQKNEFIFQLKNSVFSVLSKIKRKILKR